MVGMNKLDGYAYGEDGPRGYAEPSVRGTERYNLRRNHRHTCMRISHLIHPNFISFIYD